MTLPHLELCPQLYLEHNVTSLETTNHIDETYPLNLEPNPPLSNTTPKAQNQAISTTSALETTLIFPSDMSSPIPHSMVTCSQLGIHKPNPKYDLTMVSHEISREP